MKKVLYITNIEVPYRVKFFNELAKYCDLTVLYERDKSSNRSFSNEIVQTYKVKYLHGIKYNYEQSFSISIIKYIFNNYDEVIVGCYNSPSQILFIILSRFFKRKYSLNIDGEIFVDAKSIKNSIKKIILKGAKKYYVAGEKSAESLKCAIGSNINVIPYYFSSLTTKEIEENIKIECDRKDFILIVGQYFEYKGLDIAAEVAKKMPLQKFVFVGMGKNTVKFVNECGLTNLNNVECIPFLSKEELNKLYVKCKLLLLPSRNECWGLVINEAASFGTPIISTIGSGAALEFLSKSQFEEFITKSNPENMIETLSQFKEKETNKEFSQFLKNKSRNYSLEKMALIHKNSIYGEL